MIAVALALLVILLRTPSLEQPFHNDCGAIAYHARLILRGEPLYGTHHPAHHTPAVYYAYALAFLLLGDSVLAVKLLLVVWIYATAYLMFRLGGPAAGHHYLADPNLDWGQESIALSDYQTAHQTGVIHLGYFGSAEPSAYGVRYQCLPGLGLLDCPEADLPTDGWVAVSATCLQGLCTSDPDFYASLRARDPTDVLGHSMFLYHLPLQ